MFKITIKILILFIGLFYFADSQSMNWFKFSTCTGRYLFSCPGRELNSQYKEMKAANCKNCDKYFHCKGNFNAVKNCPGIESYNISKKISDCREKSQNAFSLDSLEDQKANLHGRNGGDCSIYLCRYKCSYNPIKKTCSKNNC